MKSALHPDTDETVLTVTIKKCGIVPADIARINTEVKKELTNLASKNKIRPKQDSLHHVEETKFPEHDATKGKGQNETEKVTNPDKPMAIELERYYAVDYVDKYYIGKVVGQKDDGYFEMKFLKKSGSKKPSYYCWPKRDDKDSVHESVVFFGPLTLLGSDQFTVEQEEDVEAKFQAIKESCQSE